MAVELQKRVVFVNGIPTVISKILPASNSYRTVIVVIPGNPGVIEFYDEFISTLFHSNDRLCPVYGISHAGHSPTKDYKKMTHQENSDSVNESTIQHNASLSLEEQILHKKAFLEDHIPQHLKIILIGHSIGAYVVLSLMKDCRRTPDIAKAILLFPTIERMALSPSGRYVTPMVTYLRWLAVGAVVAFSLLPEFIKRGLVQWWLRDIQTLKSFTVDSVLKLLTLQSAHGCATMARDEMNEVDQLDDKVIAQHLKKLLFYYGASDHWAPVSYFEDMKMRFPDGEIYLCERNFKHAFVLESSEDVANMVASWVQKVIR